MVQAGIWMVYPPELTWFLLVASWVQREVWRFDDYVEINHFTCRLESEFYFPSPSNTSIHLPYITGGGVER